MHLNGASYEGHWRDDIQHGKGCEICNYSIVLMVIGVDGSKYDGYYDNGKKHGRGRYRWADGSEYDGDWF